MKRDRVRSPRADRRWFRMTADRTRKVNVEPNVSRGGIRF